MISRQEAYQLRKIRDGLCRHCGKRPIAMPESTTNKRRPVLCERCKSLMKSRHAHNLMKRQHEKVK